MKAYDLIVETLSGILPDGWKFTDYEPANEELPEVTLLTLKIRSMNRLPAAPLGAMQIDWVLTITSGITSRESADPALAEDVYDFLVLLDSTPGLSWLSWTNATKVTASDTYDRLAYDITLTMTTNKKEA